LELHEELRGLGGGVPSRGGGRVYRGNRGHCALRGQDAASEFAAL